MILQHNLQQKIHERNINILRCQTIENTSTTLALFLYVLPFKCLAGSSCRLSYFLESFDVLYKCWLEFVAVGSTRTVVVGVNLLTKELGIFPPTKKYLPSTVRSNNRTNLSSHFTLHDSSKLRLSPSSVLPKVKLSPLFLFHRALHQWHLQSLRSLSTF